MTALGAVTEIGYVSLRTRDLVIYSGTPAGVGISRKPEKLIQPGQTLVSTIESVGLIRQSLVGA